MLQADPIITVKDTLGNTYELEEELFSLGEYEKIYSVAHHPEWMAVYFSQDPVLDTLYNRPSVNKLLSDMISRWDIRLSYRRIVWPQMKCTLLQDESIVGFFTPRIPLPTGGLRLWDLLSRAPDERSDIKFRLKAGLSLAKCLDTVQRIQYLMGLMNPAEYHVDENANVYSLLAYRYGFSTPPVTSQRYIAPELLAQTKHSGQYYQFSKESDAYAFALILFELLTGNYPFGCSPAGEREITRETEDLIVNGQSVFYYETTQECAEIEKKLESIHHDLLVLFRRAFDYCGHASYVVNRPNLSEWQKTLEEAIQSYPD